MTRSPWTPAMHAVLDGEAGPDESAALDAALAGDAAARLEFQRLEALFERFATLPPQQPPEGLVAAVSAAVREYSRSDQRVGPNGVLDSIPPEIETHVPSRPPVDTSSTFSFFGEQAMDQQSSNVFSNRKVWVGGAVAVAVVAVAAAFSLGNAPRSEDVNGTIVAAERYRAPQTTTEGVQLGDMSVAELLQNDAFLRVVKDPQVQALMVEPDFQSSAQQIIDNPESVRRSLAGDPDPQAVATLHAALAHPEAARLLLSVPQASRAISRNPQASLSFVPAEMRAQLEAQNAALANRIPRADIAPAADRSAKALGVPNADRSPSALSAPTAGAAPSAMSSTANGVPTALSAPAAESAASASSRASANAIPSALSVPTAGSAAAAARPTASAIPSALSVPTAGSTAASARPTANAIPSALSAPAAASTAAASARPTANAIPSASNAAAASSVPAAMNSTTANRSPAQQ